MQSTILVCDDDQRIAALLQDVLEAEGYRVVAVGDGAEGLRRAHAAPPDLVLSDVQMPTMDGVALTRAIRADASLAAVPIVLMSGMPTRTHGVPCDAYIQKPFRVDDLLAEIARLIAAAGRDATRERA